MGSRSNDGRPAGPGIALRFQFSRFHTLPRYAPQPRCGRSPRAPPPQSGQHLPLGEGHKTSPFELGRRGWGEPHSFKKINWASPGDGCSR